MTATHGNHESISIAPLREAASSDLYRVNAFRVLGLAVNVDGSELNRHQKKLKMLEKLGAQAPQAQTGVLPLSPPPDADTLRRAGQRLHDMQTRLVDELFWFWPTLGSSMPSGNSYSALEDGDPGYAFLQSGGLSGAEQAWSQTPEHDPGYPVAIHNLAVFHHVLALDLETSSSRQASENSSEERLDYHWKSAYRYWAEVAHNKPVWVHLASRAASLDDPRLTTSFIQELHREVPTTVLSISIGLAMQGAHRNDAQQFRRHLVYVLESRFPKKLVNRLLDQELTPLVERIRGICEPVEARCSASPADALRLAKSVLSDCAPTLRVLRVLDKEYHLRKSASHLVAETVRSAMVQYGNHTEDWDQCIATLKRITPLALDATLRNRIDDDMRQLRDNKTAKQNELAYSLLKRAMEAAEAGNPEEVRRLLQKALAAAKDLELKKTLAAYLISVNKALERQSDGCLVELGALALGLGAFIALVFVIGAVVDAFSGNDSKSSSTTSRSTSRSSYSAPGNGSSRHSNSSLGRLIRAAKSRAEDMENELERMDAELASFSLDIAMLKNEVERFEWDVRSGSQVNQYSYQQALDDYNDRVDACNTMVARRKAKYRDYSEQVDSVNDMVVRFNRGER